jgi:hypothetical protein
MRSWKALLGVLLLAALASPAAAGAAPPTQDSVVGTGITTFNFSNGVINVTSGPSGEDPTGAASAVLAGETFSSTSVECLSVTGNSATFVISLAPNSMGAIWARVTVVDNSSTGSPDTLAVAGYVVQPDCTPEPGFFGTESLIAGDIVVVDAPPLPTSKEQCKNGGWRDFGVFKNQGDCVSFVATSGKNPPGGP